MSQVPAQADPVLPGVRILASKLRSPVAALPLRTAAIELQQGQVLWSPASTLDASTFRALGPVSDIIAPNLLHTGGMPVAAEAHPTARRWGPPGAQAKQPAMSWKELGGDAWPHDSELSVLPIDGMPDVREFAFLHHASGTLFLTDLAFHVTEPVGLLTGLLLRAVGTWRRFAVSRLFLTQVRDRKALEASIAKLVEWDFENVVVAHGQMVLGDGRTRLLAALRERRLLG